MLISDNVHIFLSVHIYGKKRKMYVHTQQCRNAYSKKMQGQVLKNKCYGMLLVNRSTKKIISGSFRHRMGIG